MKNLFYLLLTITILSCDNNTQLSKSKNDKLPNIIIIYTDDQGYGDLS